MYFDLPVLKPSISRSIFPEKRIQDMAKLIVECGGLVKPLLVQEDTMEGYTQTYRVLSGNLEYYAAIEAKKLDLANCEMVNAFYLKKGVDPAPYLKQLR
jgi:hypothetical protein